MKIKGNGKNLIQKFYVVVMFILLLGILALQKEKFLGYRLFVGESDSKQATQYTEKEIKKLFVNATNYIVQHDSILVFSGEKQIGWAYNTSPGSDSIIGFASSVPLLLGFNKKDILLGITLLKNYESPDFVQKIIKKGFVNTWDNPAISEIANLKVDAIAGATLTSVAIEKTLKHSIGKISKQAVSISDEVDYLGVFKVVMGYLLVVIALLQFFSIVKLKKLKVYFQLILIIILGFWMGSFLSLFSVYNWTLHGIDLSSKLFVFIVLTFSVVLPLITDKSFYCTYLCPFGASQDIMGKIRKERIKLSPNVKKFLSSLREKIFATIMLVLFTGVGLDLTNVEPFSAFLFRSASIPIVVMAVTFLILSVFIPRAWCNYACPTGYVLETTRKPFKNK